MIIFDLDGTLAEIEHRRHLVQGKRGEVSWDAFYQTCVSDTPKKEVIGLFLDLRDHYGKDVEIWSGRADVVRGPTEEWLTRHVFRHSQWMDIDSRHYCRLRMRPAKDNTPDAKLKEMWLMAELALGRKVKFVVDDRQRVVDMWRKNGITCFQCAPGEY